MVDKIIAFLEQDNFTTEDVLNTFTYNERRTIALEGTYDTAVFLRECQKRNIKILTNEEAWELINETSIYEEGTLIDTLADYLTQKQIYDYTLYYGFTIVTYRLTEGKYVLALLETGKIPDEERSNCIGNIEEDDYKLEAMRRFLKKEDYFSIVISLKTDEKRIESLKYLNRAEKSELIERIDSDEIKERFINLMRFGKGDIIASLKSDQKKEHYFNKLFNFLGGYDKGRILASFKDLSYIEKYLDRLKSDIAIVQYLIRSKRTDDIHIKEKLASKLKKDSDILYALNSIPEGEIRNRLLDKLRSDKYIKELFSAHKYYTSDALYLIDRVSENTKYEIIKRLSRHSIVFKLLSRFTDEKKIINIVEHQDSYPEYKDEYEYIVDIYVKKYNLNKEHLIKLLRIVGCSLFNQIKNSNIQNTINLDEESFTKYLGIINTENINVTESAQNDVLNSFIQREFRIRQKLYYEIFPSIIHAFEDHDYDKAKELLEEVEEYVDLDEYQTSVEELFIILSNNPKEEDITKLQQITTKYLVLKRNEFVRSEMTSSRNQCSKRRYEKNAYVSFYVRRNNPEDVLNYLKEDIIDGFELTKEEIELVRNPELFKKLFLFKKDPSSVSIITPEEKKKINILASIIDKVFNTHVSNKKEIPIKYEIKPTSMLDVVNIMASIKPEQLKDTLFTDEKSYQELLDFLKQYRILGWSGKYEKIAMDADVNYSNETIAELINNYGAIISAIEKDANAKHVPVQKTLTRIMDRASLYDTYSYRYNILFGKEDMMYLKTNPTPNSSGLSREERLRIATNLIPKMYQKKSIPVPPLDRDFTLDNNKKINVVVGNTTDMMNLTYGERTGACMRIGGAGDSLFNYCLTGKNGFHIRFTDPRTNEFVSRVSCFRNGNTLFMNQLRESVSSEYSNTELVEVATKLAEYLIEITKDSESPIENVVVDCSYAMNASKKRPQGLNIENAKKGLGDFYSDVDNYAIVLATTNEGKLVPIDLTKHVPEYLPQRSKILTYIGEKAGEMVAHYHLLDEILSGHSIDNKEIIVDPNIVTCYCGEDWYISIDELGQINSYVLKNSRRKKEALQEMENVLNRLKTNTEIYEERKLA